MLCVCFKHEIIKPYYKVSDDVMPVYYSRHKSKDTK